VSVRVLLDENMPHKLRIALDGCDTYTALEYEQDMRGRRIGVISLSAPHWRFVKRHVDDRERPITIIVR
jgi:hypothetical protein